MAVLHPRLPHQMEIHARLLKTPEGTYIMVRYGEQEWKLDVKENVWTPVENVKIPEGHTTIISKPTITKRIKKAVGL